MTLEQFEAQLAEEGRLDEYIARKQEKARRIAARASRVRAEQAPLLSELRDLGLSINALSDLINTSERYPRAVPVLLKHLLMPYSDVTRQTLARALAVPEARYAWPTLLGEYRKAQVGKGDDGIRLGAKDGLAVALAAIATDDVIGDVIALAKDMGNGESRGLLLSALRRSKTAAAKEALAELATDPELAKEIASWRRSGRKST